MAQTTKSQNEWTIMFFFASDNALSALIVSQLKAIKDAGFQENTEVLVHFDSNEPGVPTRIFNVNSTRKSAGQSKTAVGDGTDPFIHDMIDDMVDPSSIDASAGPASEAVKRVMSNERTDTVTATEALENFIGYCRENHRARHYVLFLVGHGMIVGADKFLSDENPVSGITLRGLGDMLSKFSNQVREQGDSFELLALHSCSMSAIEVAYQLQGTANYLLASEGLSYVGSWPYRQLLKDAFNVIEDANQKAKAKMKQARMGDQAVTLEVGVQDLVSKIYDLSLCNTTDFAFSGYSLDICLSQLAPDQFTAVREKVPTLVVKLKEGLDDERARQLILLAHLKSQSFWGEEYTDLKDFCHCLHDLCDSSGLQGQIKTACQDLFDILESDPANPFSKLIVFSDNFGWQYQYARGLSIYFPWAEPVGQADENLVVNYEEYAFNKDLGANSWSSFLREYFVKTKRPIEEADSRAKLVGYDALKPGSSNQTGPAAVDGAAVGLTGTVSSALNAGALSKPTGAFAKPTAAFEKPTGASGIDCGCPSIKNYPTAEIRVKGKKRRVTVRAFSCTRGAFKAFKQ
jgi:hypothetical protein